MVTIMTKNHQIDENWKGELPAFLPAFDDSAEALRILPVLKGQDAEELSAILESSEEAAADYVNTLGENADQFLPKLKTITYIVGYTLYLCRKFIPKGTAMTILHHFYNFVKDFYVEVGKAIETPDYKFRVPQIGDLPDFDDEEVKASWTPEAKDKIASILEFARVTVGIVFHIVDEAVQKKRKGPFPYQTEIYIAMNALEEFLAEVEKHLKDA